MSLGNWFQRVFSARGGVAPKSAEDAAALREEYGSGAPGPPPGMVGAPGVSGLAGLETAEAVEAQETELEPPSDPAP